MLGIFKKRKQKYEDKTDYYESGQESNTEEQECDEEVTLEQAQELVASLKEKAENGDVQAMQWLGDIYYQGQGGIPQNKELTFKYWKMAADHGHIDMAFKTGLLYKEPPRSDYEKCFYYVKMAADGGNEDAMYVLHILLASGLGCTKNVELAYEYLKMAAACGQKSAVENLSKWE